MHSGVLLNFKPSPSHKKKQQPHQQQVPTESSTYGNWSQAAGKQYCVSDPGLAWEERNDISCDIRWPQARCDPPR